MLYMATRTTAVAPAEITLKRIGRAMAKIPVEGTTPLIVNKFSEKGMARPGRQPLGGVRAERGAP